MMSRALLVVLPLLVIAPAAHGAPKWPAIFDATRGADKPTQLEPAVNKLGLVLNSLGASGAQLKNGRFVIIFHGAAVDGLLNDEAYRAKFNTPNPNLPVLTELKKAGVEEYVCGQYLVSENIDRATLSPDVTVASGAPIVLITYQNRGYALMSF
jgi:intracellular sulfur oxidation DsrE/DsrF family protein